MMAAVEPAPEPRPLYDTDTEGLTFKKENTNVFISGTKVEAPEPTMAICA